MSKRNSLLGFVGLIVLSVFVTRALSEDEAADATAAPAAKEATDAKAPSPEEQAAMMQKMVAAMTPGEMHKQLEPLVGKWTTTSKIWCQSPGAEPMSAKGMSEVTWVLDGHYVMEHQHGTMQMPGPDGKPKDFKFEGMGVIGYDNFKKAYTMGWCDNMSTQMITAVGSYDAGSKTFTFYGQMDDPMTDSIAKPVKYVVRMTDGGNHVFEIHDLSMGAEGTKMLEVTYVHAGE